MVQGIVPGAAGSDSVASTPEPGGWVRGGVTWSHGLGMAWSATSTAQHRHMGVGQEQPPPHALSLYLEVPTFEGRRELHSTAEGREKPLGAKLLRKNTRKFCDKGFYVDWKRNKAGD